MSNSFIKQAIIANQIKNIFKRSSVWSLTFRAFKIHKIFLTILWNKIWSYLLFITLSHWVSYGKAFQKVVKYKDVTQFSFRKRQHHRFAVLFCGKFLRNIYLMFLKKISILSLSIQRRRYNSEKVTAFQKKVLMEKMI